MTYVILVTILLLLQFMYFMGLAGSARGKADIKAPATTGDEAYERANRVHLNTLEQLIITLPAMWICAVYFRTDVAAILGAAFLVGRFVYAAAYQKDPSKRGTGMMIGFLANIALLLCGLYVVVSKLF